MEIVKLTKIILINATCVCCHGCKEQMASLSRTGEDSSASASEPQCINWSVEKVAEWIESLGFKEYKV